MGQSGSYRVQGRGSDVCVALHVIVGICKSILDFGNGFRLVCR